MKGKRCEDKNATDMSCTTIMNNISVFENSMYRIMNEAFHFYNMQYVQELITNDTDRTYKALRNCVSYDLRLCRIDW